jgi:ubiquinone/menaquinone biosynthesis C-methylase UbiE
MTIRDRVKELRRVRAGDLQENAANWRRHPKAQVDALAGVISEIGFAGALIAYEDDNGTLTLIDGHMRAGVSADQELPVVVLDVNEAEAKKLLATYDPIGAMAQTDTDALMSLLGDATFQAEPVNAMLEALANGERLPLAPPMEHAEADNWGTDTVQGTAIETAGYDLGSVWPRSGDSETRVFSHLVPLPRNRNESIRSVRANYSRSPAGEMERIVQTYMREGDYFLEVCAGWWTFSTAAAVWGYSGVGIDIWDTSIDFGREQLAKLPQGSGHIRIVEGDARAMPFQDGEFDFIYCNPPFFDLEKYSGDERDMSQNPTVDAWLADSETMMREMARVAKPGSLIVTVMADYREKGILIPLHSYWMDAAARAGLILHDLAVQHLLSQQLRFWRHAYNAKRTAKAHEYVIVFQVPATGHRDRHESPETDQPEMEPSG